MRKVSNCVTGELAFWVHNESIMSTCISDGSPGALVSPLFFSSKENF